jgi:DNA-binding SARP family transcriptional activator
MANKQERQDDTATSIREEFPQVTIWTFGLFTICGPRGESLVVGRRGDTLCQVLLCQPGRKAESAFLTDQIWPQSEADQAVNYLYSAAWAFRSRVSADLLLTHKQGSSYQLVGQERLWVDVDAALALLAQAEVMGGTTTQALSLLEQAARYFRRGKFLAGIEETWVYARRAYIETMRERGLCALAEAYRLCGKMQQAEMVLVEALTEDPLNENLLCLLMQTFHEEGMTHRAVRAYEQFSRALKNMDLVPAEETTALYEQVRKAPHVRKLAVFLAPGRVCLDAVSESGEDHQGVPGPLPRR